MLTAGTTYSDKRKGKKTNNFTFNNYCSASYFYAMSENIRGQTSPCSPWFLAKAEMYLDWYDILCLEVYVCESVEYEKHLDDDSQALHIHCLQQISSYLQMIPGWASFP